MPLKTNQVNIGTEAELKYATLGDYWDDAMWRSLDGPGVVEVAR